MASWQYAWMTDQPYTTIGFSHPQPGLAQELAGVLGVGVFMPQSSEWSISLDRSRVNLGYVSGLLGDRGWEMFAVETRLQPNAMNPAQLQTNWYFKRAGGHSEPAMTASASAPAAAPTPAAGGPISTYGMGAPVAPTAPAMPAPPAAAAAPSMDAAPAAPATDAMPATPYAAPAFPNPQTPPTGPDQAPMSGTQTPPPGPGQGQ